MWISDAPGASTDEAPPSPAPQNMPSKPDWRRRWLVVRIVLIFCALVVAYAVGFGANDRLRETALLGAFSLAGAVALGYLGFAVQDDLNWMRRSSQEPKA